MRHRRPVPIAIRCALALVASPVPADTMFVATLDGTPECPSVTTTATGFGTFVLNAAETQRTLHVEYAGLVGAQTNQHIHNAVPPGSWGRIKILYR